MNSDVLNRTLFSQLLHGALSLIIVDITLVDSFGDEINTKLDSVTIVSATSTTTMLIDYIVSSDNV
jgi:hypothetical protein